MKKPWVVGLLQAIGIGIYLSLIAFIMQNGNNWFGPLNNFLGPMLFLTLFSVSALICGLLAFAYPVHLFWVKKEASKALITVGYTTLFLFLLMVIVMLAVTLI